MLTSEQAKAIAATWRPRFSNEEAYERSVMRYRETATVPDADRLESWLEQDLARDQALAALVPQEPLVPQLSRYDLNGCYHCYGRGFVRLDVPASHPEFGKGKRCPACLGRDGDQSAHCDKCAAFSKAGDHSERHQCWKCRQYEDEPAAESCGNPGWHIPNANHVDEYVPNRMA